MPSSSRVAGAGSPSGSGAASTISASRPGVASNAGSPGGDSSTFCAQSISPARVRGGVTTHRHLERMPVDDDVLACRLRRVPRRRCSVESAGFRFRHWCWCVLRRWCVPWCFRLWLQLGRSVDDIDCALRQLLVRREHLNLLRAPHQPSARGWDGRNTNAPATREGGRSRRGCPARPSRAAPRWQAQSRAARSSRARPPRPHRSPPPAPPTTAGASRIQ